MRRFKRAFLAASFALFSTVSAANPSPAGPQLHRNQEPLEERAYYERFAYSLSEDVRVFLLGELHNKKASSLFAVKVLLPILKEKGFGALALECDHSLQPLINTHLADVDAFNLINSFLVEGYNPGDFVPFILEAKKNGMAPYCIDNIPLDKNPREISPSDFVARDLFMAKNIREIIEKHDKVLVVIGYTHTKDVPFEEVRLFGRRFVMVPLRWLLDKSLGPEKVFNLTTYLTPNRQ